MTDEPEEIHGELVPHDPQSQPVAAPPGNLFHTDDPVEVVTRATAVANALKPVLQSQGMLQRIGPKDHVKVEGWTTLGAMLGVVPVVVWTHRVTDPDGWEAKVEARTLDGRVIGAAEAQCDRAENRWKTADEYAIRSMAQTRAQSKALAAPLRFIITLAGFEPTPAEEMPTEPQYGSGQAPAASSSGSGPSGSDTASGKQQGMIRGLVRQKHVAREDLQNHLASVGAEPTLAKGWTGRLTKRQASGVIEWLTSLPTPDPERPSDLDNDTSGFGPSPSEPQDSAAGGVEDTEGATVDELPFDGEGDARS